MHLQPHGGEMYSTRQKNTSRLLSSPKERHSKQVETRRDAGKTYGMLASQRNRIAVEKRVKKETVNSRSSNTAQEKSASPKVKLKSPTADSSKERLSSSESTTRVQAWLCENPVLSVKFGPTTEDKAAQTNHSSIQSPAAGTADLDCHTYCTENTLSSDDNTSHCQKDTLAASKMTPAYDLTSSCTIEENEREKQEEIEVLARIQELKETKNALLAERRVILLKIEEVKLRQEVRALQRDVCKSRDELNILTALEERNTTQSTTDTKYLAPGQPNTEDCTLVLDTQQAVLTRESSTNQELVTDTDDGVADVIRKADDTHSVKDYQPSVASPRNNTQLAESSFKEKDTDHPYCNTTTNEASRNEEADGVTGSDLSEIKEHISRNSGLKSAPVIPIAASREEIPGSFTKASSYDGIEMLPEYDVEAEDVSSKALDDAISRLAGGRLDVENEEDDKESSSEGDVIFRSDDDDDDEEYSTTMLDSIPLSPPALDSTRKESDRDIIHLRSESDGVHPSRAVRSSAVVSLPIAQFPPEPQKPQMDTAITDFCPSTVFWSPRNGRGSPRSPRRSTTETDGMRNQLSPDMDASASDASQCQRLPSTVPDALITASSCSSCWVQFSQTDRDYIQDLVAKFVRAFCDPQPPDYIDAEDLPIPLEAFAAIEKESGGSFVQEAFDRAIFDAVNQRLSEMYRSLGRLKVTPCSPDGHGSNGVGVQSKGLLVGGYVWSVPCYSSLLEGVQRSVFSMTDCDADPLAPYTSKEQVIEQMLIQGSHRLRKNQRAASKKTPFPTAL